MDCRCSVDWYLYIFALCSDIYYFACTTWLSALTLNVHFSVFSGRVCGVLRRRRTQKRVTLALTQDHLWICRRCRGCANARSNLLPKVLGDGRDQTLDTVPWNATGALPRFPASMPGKLGEAPVLFGNVPSFVGAVPYLPSTTYRHLDTLRWHLFLLVPSHWTQTLDAIFILAGGESPTIHSVASCWIWVRLS